ncbi:hypothetical protein [Candidatus Leptofilum sp.]|uniref:hypothetical protein n=1 Tax=Candidatus Leptofilum sp. TaxID=3241576 RepID=UPI003B5AEC05
MTNVTDLKQIQRITRNFEYLQGLRQVPFGILFLCIAAWRAGWWPWIDKWHPISAFLLIGITVFASWRIEKYYERSFGRVKKLKSSRSKEIVIGFLVVGGIFLIGRLEQLWGWSISATGLFIAILSFTTFILTDRFRIHFLMIAIVMVVLSLLPLTNLLSVEQLGFWSPFSAAGVAIFGLLWLFGGLMDHWHLVRALDGRSYKDEQR